jgi:hypothetical protein
MYNARPLVWSYGKIIATTTHETFAALARPQRQVHVRYTHTYTNPPRQSSKSMYHARRLVCSYGEMIANTTHENFVALARPKRQVHVDIYTHTHPHTHTETGHQIHLPHTTTCLQLRRNDCNFHARDFRCTCEPTAASPCYVHTQTHTHTHTETGQQVHEPRTAPCVQLRRNDCNYHARELRELAPHSGKSMLDIHTHTNRERPASPCTTHGPLSAIKEK